MADNTSLAEHDFNVDLVDEWGKPTTFPVCADRTIAYALATNDPIQQHLDGTYAPPLFAVVPPLGMLAAAALAVVPEELRMRILHGEQDIRIHRPIKPGDELTSRAKVVGIHGKSSGVIVTALVEMRDQNGDLVNEQYFSLFFRGGNWPHEVGTSAPKHSFDSSLRDREADFVVSQQFDEDQTFRYTGPSGDTMPIHLDDAIAKKFGLPGIIIHGLCTMAFESHAVLTQLGDVDPARLKRIAVRFASPARPGQVMTTSIWKSGSNDGVAQYSFESVNDEGQNLITDGLIEIAAE